jgi:hypothetical protein
MTTKERLRDNESKGYGRKQKGTIPVFMAGLRKTTTLKAKHPVFGPRF